MTAISASLVKELRDQTGAGMMDCKRALEETAGDMEAAVRILRERGAAQAAKRSGRETPEGIVLARIENGKRDAGRRRLRDRARFEERRVPRVRAKRARDGRGRGDDVGIARGGAAGAPRGRSARTSSSSGPHASKPSNGAKIDSYVHPPANKLGVLVQVRGGSGELGRKIAMHIAASSPRWVAREDVPEEVVTSEREIYSNSDEVQSKPEQAREKIVEGMLNKRFFAAQVLAEQPWIHDTAKTVGQALEEEGAEVLEFERFALAG